MSPGTGPGSCASTGALRNLAARYDESDQSREHRHQRAVLRAGSYRHGDESLARAPLHPARTFDVMTSTMLVSTSYIIHASYSMESFPLTCDFLVEYTKDNPDLNDIVIRLDGKVRVKAPRIDRYVEFSDIVTLYLAEAIATWEVEPVPADQHVGRVLAYLSRQAATLLHQDTLEHQHTDPDGFELYPLRAPNVADDGGTRP